MTGAARTHLEEVDQYDLLTAWDEIADWEETGTLPEAAYLRCLTRAVFPAGSGTLLELQHVSAEVWRAVAVRGLTVPQRGSGESG